MTDYLCPTCKKKIGNLLKIGNLTLLQVNGMTLRALHGVCDCGATVHFFANDKLLEDLVNRITKRDKIEVGV